MPKVVDHEGRRAELAAAVWRIALREGFDAVTVRSVAEEAGWSAGALRHYYPDKQEMVLSAIDFAVAAVRERVAAANAAAGKVSVELVRGLLEQLLPLDPARRVESEAWFALAVLARTDPAAARRRAEVDGLIRGAVDSALLALAELGRLGAGRSLAAEAARLHALLDGLVVQLLADPPRLSVDEARGVVAAQVAEVGTALPAGS